MTTTTRHSRQSFLGQNSETVLAQATIGIVGLCGGGSHACQQLAHIGVGHFVVADFDHVEDSNLTRMVGSCPADAIDVRQKTDVIRDMIHRINPKAEVTAISGQWEEHGMALRKCSIIVGCVDKYSVRNELEKFCRRFLIPYVDLGMDVTESPGGHSISGQVILSVPGGPCLWCLGLLNEKRLAEEQAKYGVAGGKPQVIWPNGVLASIAVGQVVSLLLPWNANLSIPAMIEYDGNRQITRESPRLGILRDLPCQHFLSEGNVGDPFFDYGEMKSRCP